MSNEFVKTVPPGGETWPLIGSENISAESLAALTKLDYLGDYARARLDGKLINIVADVSKKINDEGMAKTLISRETVSARHPHQRGFDMQNYARLAFAMNELPPQLFTDPALTKRSAILEFDQQIPEHNKDTDFAEKVIGSELSGVLNWLIGGLTRLIATGRLDPPPCCVEAMERIRIEVDPLSGWLEERGYYQGNSENILLKSAYCEFDQYCRENNNQSLAKRTFAQRLRNLGYRVDNQNHRIGTIFYFQRSIPNLRSTGSTDSLARENAGENVEQTGNEPTDHSTGSAITPPSAFEKTGMGSEWSEGNEKIQQRKFYDVDTELAKRSERKPTEPSNEKPNMGSKSQQQTTLFDW